MNVLIMAGGGGSRFWPMSVDAKPKQFLSIGSERTLIQETYDRFAGMVEPECIYVMTTKEYRDLVREQLPDIGEERILTEPYRRDTGPCIALAARYFLGLGKDDVLVTTPSDQYVGDPEALKAALQRAEAAACDNRAIATLGIVPTRPETGYGYIETDAEPSEQGVYRVRRFTEKPSAEQAMRLIAKGNMFWNSGIYVWRPSTIAHYMGLHQKKLWEAVNAELPLLEKAYAGLRKLSIDYAIVEKADRLYMVKADFDWDDVGVWTALERIHAPDEHGNHVQGDVRTACTSNSIIVSEHLKTVVVGVNDLIIVSTGNGLLVCRKSEEQSIKGLLNETRRRIR